MTAFHPLPNTDWHSLSAEDCLQQLYSDRFAGLSTEQVKGRLQTYGANELQESNLRARWQILLDQFTNIMLLMLIGVALVSGWLDLTKGRFPKDAIAIFAIVILNGVLGYLQESRAEQALAALKRMTPLRIRVLRNGEEEEIEAPELVPGDIMLVEAGTQLAADGRLIEAVNLQVREAALTGEAEAVIKDATALLEAKASLGDRANMVFRGTEIVQGRGVVVITQTGMQTELGRIASLIQGVENEPTPLQNRMANLGNVLVSGSLILVAIVVVGGILRTGDFSLFEKLLEVSLSMAVAVVPEGLPAVITVTLALGTQRMVRRRALIRKLPAVETLGSVTTICSDKTGTLTQNKMVAQHVCTLDRTYQVSGEGYSPQGQFLTADAHPRETDLAFQDPSLKNLLLVGTLCNDSSLIEEEGEWSILGDPTEGALVVLAAKLSLQRSTLQKEWPRCGELPFSAERKRMSVLVERPPQSATFATQAPYLLFTKGSPELVRDRCIAVHTQEGCLELTEDQRQQIAATNDRLAQQGLRVLGLAYRALETLPQSLQISDENNLTWLGLVGIQDAPRPEVREAVQRCQKAGIRPVMITGDHPLTAEAIAESLGISQPGTPVLQGVDLEKMSSLDLDEQVERISVYARVSPEHKLRIVQSLQRRHHVVAMTGDGVNDAPALKQADIGVAMGITGTDVSKEASDMVLLDDNFATIVAAVEEGRVVYDNIRRFIKYILGSNIGEVLTIAAAPIIGLGDVPLTPLQILWMNLVTDGLPALALAMEPPQPEVMKRSPYDPKDSIFAQGLGWYMLRIGLIFAILTIVLMNWAYHHSLETGHPERWKSMVFTTLCIAQMGHALAVRSDKKLTVQLNPFSNPYLLCAVVVTTLLQVGLLYIPPLQTFFGVYPLSGTELLICFGFSALMFIWIEMEKVVVKLWRSK
ncbi:MAG: cation-translocating P-type ATPase [Prochlorotrichaceae cyanobacterium]